MHLNRFGESEHGLQTRSKNQDGAKSSRQNGEVSKVWAYIKANKLQNPENGREIVADDKLRKVFGKDKVTMFEMNKHLAQHLT